MSEVGDVGGDVSVITSKGLGASKEKAKEKNENAIDKTRGGAEEIDKEAEESDLGLSSPLSDSSDLEVKSSKSVSSMYSSVRYHYDDIFVSAAADFCVNGESFLMDHIHIPSLYWASKETGGAPLRRGGQALSLFFALERSIEKLSQGGKTLRFVFFDALRGDSEAKASDSTRDAMAADYALLRRLFILHLRAISSSSSSSHMRVVVNEFPYWTHSTFQSYLTYVDPSFILVGDVLSHSPSLTEYLQQFILHLLQRNLRVIRHPEISYRTNAIHAFQYVATRVTFNMLKTVKMEVPQLSTGSGSLPAVDSTLLTSLAKTPSYVSLLSLLPPKRSRCLLFSLYSISKCLTGASAATIDLCKALYVHTLLLYIFPIDRRGFSDDTLNDNPIPAEKLNTANNLIDTYLLHFSTLVHQCDVSESKGDFQFDYSLLDFIDVRLLRFVLSLSAKGDITNLGVPPKYAEWIPSLWTAVCKSSPLLPWGKINEVSLPQSYVDEAKTPVSPGLHSPTYSPSSVVSSESGCPPGGAPVIASAEQEPVLDSWEDLEEDEEASKPPPPSKSAPVESKPTPTEPPKTIAPSAPSLGLHPIARIDNPLVNTLSRDVETALNRSHLIQQRYEPPLPPFYQTSGFPSGAAVDDGIPNPDVDNSPKALKNTQRYLAYLEKFTKSFQQGKLVLREVMVEKDKKDDEKDGKKGKTKEPKKAVSAKDKIKEEVMAKKREESSKKVQRLIMLASAQKSMESKIQTLDTSLESIYDESSLLGLFQVLEWQFQLWKDTKGEGNFSAAAKVWVVLHDIFRRFKPFVTSEHVGLMHRYLTLMGFTDVAAKILKSYVQNLINNGNSVLKGKSTLEAEMQAFETQFCGQKTGLSSSSDCQVGMSAARFQMAFVGPYMLRNVNSSPDSRVEGFYPDKWQRDLLDIVDRRESALIVAATSSGKTFISYYAMKQVLLENKTIERPRDRGIVVYVVPTKALITQIAGDIYKRYGFVYGQLTPDYSEKVFQCEVLITVPECFETLLMSAQRESYVKQIKYCIFDEIHNLSSDPSGYLWERCVSMISCPFLALSATVGNAQLFHHWMQRVENLRGRRISLIVQTTRWSDLEKYAYLPKNYRLEGNDHIDDLELKDIRLYRPPLTQLSSIHPMSAITTELLKEMKEIPEELTFSPKDSLALFDAMKKHSSKLPSNLSAALHTLDPDSYFAHMLCIDRPSATEYERVLKAQLGEWNRSGFNDICHAVVDELSDDLRAKWTLMRQNDPPHTVDYTHTYEFQKANLLPLLLEMHSDGKLPALVFCLASDLCRDLAESLLKELEFRQTRAWKEENHDDTEKARQKEREKAAKQAKRLRDKQMNEKEREENAKEGFDDSSTADLETDTELYDVDPRFSFIGEGEQMDSKELEWWVERMLWKTGWPRDHPLVRALYRGIGVHHAALNKTYRDIVETLFRGKHIKIVICTSTLSVGINMPARTVVFCGDHKSLNPLVYRQVSGRAGRRGYDNVGYVIFFGVPQRKVNRLLISPLQSLKGHYPLNSSVALRGVHLYNGSSNPTSVLSQLTALIREPFFSVSWPGRHLLTQIQYHYRYSLEFLFDRHFITSKGASIGLTSLAQFIHEAEPNNFAFIELMESGIIEEVCKRFDNDKAGAARELMTLLAHLFLLVPIPAHLEREDFHIAPSSVSMILLPPLRPAYQQVINRHNERALATFTEYIQSFHMLELKDAITSNSTSTSSVESSLEEKEVKSVEANQSKSSAKSDVRDKKGKKVDRVEKGTKAASTTASGEDSAVFTPPVIPCFEGFTQLPVSGAEFTSSSSMPSLASSSPISSNCLSLYLSSHSLPVRAASPFSSLSGHRDSFVSGRDFEMSVRNGVHLEASNLPITEAVDHRGRKMKLSAYAVDFLRHGQHHLLVSESGLRDQYSWQLLKEWNLLLQRLESAICQLVGDEKNKPPTNIIAKTFRYLSHSFKELFDGIAARPT